MRGRDMIRLVGTDYLLTVLVSLPLFPFLLGSMSFNDTQGLLLSMLALALVGFLMGMAQPSRLLFGKHITQGRVWYGLFIAVSLIQFIPLLILIPDFFSEKSILEVLLTLTVEG